MKKLITVWILLFALNLFSHAQEGGKFILGGSFELQSSDYENQGSYYSYNSSTTINSLNFMPDIGYQFNENFSIGVLLEYTSVNSSSSTSGSGKAFAFAPYLRFTNSITEHLKYFAQPFAGKAFDLDDETEHPTDNFMAGLDFGLQYFLTPKISCELVLAGFGYVYAFDADTNEQLNQFIISFNAIEPQLGFKFYF